MKKTSNEIVSKSHIDKNQENWKEHNSTTSRIRESRKCLSNTNSHRKCKISKFLYKRRISNIDSSTCLCDHQRQIMKHVIVSCLQHDRTEIKNEKKNRWIIEVLLTQQQNWKSLQDE